MTKQKLLGPLKTITITVGIMLVTVGWQYAPTRHDQPVTLARAPVTMKAPTAPGTTVLSNEKAAIDASNLSEGYVSVKYTAGSGDKAKVQITKSGGTTYTYDLNTQGSYEVFPLTEGNGAYSIKVFKNISGTKFSQAYSTTVNLALTNEFSPFLYSNQYVNFTSSSSAVAKAKELVSPAGELGTITNVYNYVTANITYDAAKAATVQSGYLPNVDATLQSGTGICFDYAATMAAMLRSQGIPTKLVIGYTGKVYHAWINTYISNVGWVDNVIYFDGVNWQLMDPTFASSSKGNKDVMKYIGDGKNYQSKFVY